MSASLLFREATESDRPAMAAIYLQCLAEADWMPESFKVGVDFDRDTEGELLFVVERGGEVVGFVSFWEPESFIHHLYVAPSAQERGVGSLLLMKLQHHVRLPWRLKCSQDNEWAHRFYLSRGWVQLELGDSDAGPYRLMEWAGSLASLSPRES
jgi:GNAT superfamily N-acetyltransferase